MTSVFSLSADEDYRTLDAGLLIPNASIGDLVWLDANFNGVFDAGESGVAGVGVSLFEFGSSTAIASTTTGATGFYQFSSLVPGDYQVGFATPFGLAFTARDAGGDDSIDSDADRLTGLSGLITVGYGQYDASVDAGVCDASNPSCGRAGSIPEPGTGVLLFLGLAGLLGARLRRG